MLIKNFVTKAGSCLISVLLIFGVGLTLLLFITSDKEYATSELIGAIIFFGSMYSLLFLIPFFINRYIKKKEMWLVDALRDIQNKTKDIDDIQILELTEFALSKKGSNKVLGSLESIKDTLKREFIKRGLIRENDQCFEKALYTAYGYSFKHAFVKARDQFMFVEMIPPNIPNYIVTKNQITSVNINQGILLVKIVVHHDSINFNNRLVLYSFT